MSDYANPAGHSRKIPRQEWDAIVARHGAGESLASIARAYSCTAPAIRYVLKQQTRADRPTSAVSQSPTPQPQIDPSRDGRIGGPHGGFGAASAPDTRPADELGAPLRDAMLVEIATFLVTFDGAVENATPQALDQLRGATDRLLRAIARTRIALERVAGGTAPRKADLRRSRPPGV